jgi:hypothetical protein
VNRLFRTSHIFVRTHSIPEQTGKRVHFVVARFALFALAALTLSSVVIQYTRNASVSAATNNTINFQARVLTAAGAVVPDGAYNVQFNLYSASSGGAAMWTETYLNSATQGIVTKNGYITTALGSITSFPGTIQWDQNLWIGMTIRGTGSCAFAACSPIDAEMTPRMKVTSTPFATAAAQLQTSNGNFVSPALAP